MYHYYAFGLTIRCGWKIFQLEETSFTEKPDVIISQRLREATFQLKTNDDIFFTDNLKIVNSRKIYLNIPGVATFEVINGNVIIVHALSNTVQQTLNLYILGSAIGAIFHQREILPLHGCAIENDNNSATVVLGHSGVGKSTLAGKMYTKGHRILSDDVCAIDLSGKVFPSYPFIKLWKDSLELLSLSYDESHRITYQKEKFYVPIYDQFCRTPLKLSKIVIIEEHTSNDKEISIEHLSGLQKLTSIRNHIYRLPYLHAMFPGRHEVIRRLSLIMHSMPTYRLERPIKGQWKEQITDVLARLPNDS